MATELDKNQDEYYIIKYRDVGKSDQIQLMQQSQVLSMKKMSNGEIKSITPLNSIIYKEDQIRKVFNSYNNSLKLNNVQTFIHNLRISAEQKGIIDEVTKVISSSWYTNYIKHSPSKFFEKMWLNKTMYLELIDNATINASQKGEMWMKIEQIPIIKKKIMSGIRSKIMNLIFFIGAWTWIWYFVLNSLIPKMLLLNDKVVIDMVLPNALFLTSQIMLGTIILLYALSWKFYVQYLNFFLKFSLTARIIRWVNAIELLSIYLLGIASANYWNVVNTFNKSFPYLEDPNKNGSVWGLIQKIFDDREKNKYFDIEHLSIILSMNWKGTSKIQEISNDLLKWVIISLDDDLIQLKNILFTLGMMWAVLGISWPMMAFVSIMMWIQGAIWETLSGRD